MSEVTLGNLYDINKEIMKTQSPLTQEEIEDGKEKILDYIESNDYNNYFMLLCNERHDYTIFHFKDNENTSIIINPVADDIVDCMYNRDYYILSIEPQNGTIEIWVRTTDTQEVYVYYFFFYDRGVIEYE